ncbi:unnamed protein product (macronuclear) [Paramecium tetraurelia]|uniref:Calcium-dependent protein kinase 1 n=1 Tax=Paramecium tetraurelia TaxID=5888 RepID=A0CY41_PARTE|nr:uncharacterized protein GSPATT00011340001 [Paramecium tetraurelia]CAK75708.1 unnamed protein product [Paramecium tetraurelia]|eukprot:XP_001443105.1 hypothetical protein (macronuclear) [Paramecium tetraurelia strain d4-2]
MGSQCCKNNNIRCQEEVILQNEQTANASPNPLQKVSLSQQGSKKSQIEEDQQMNVAQQPGYCLESENNQDAEQQEEMPKKEIELIKKEESVPLTKIDSSDASHIITAKEEIKKKNEPQGPGVRIKLGHDIFVKLKEGSIGSHYNFGKVLGQGAFGKVWKVTHKTTGLVRAIKQLKKSSLIKEDEQRMFSEMNILKNLDHPHIVKLFELYQDENNYYLVTEYLSGGELFDRIKKMSSFSENIAADYIRQILLATMHCHQQNIVHRDLKPENVIFINEDPNSQLKVIDFGTSRKFDNTKAMSKRLGTPYYIAPEVLNHQYNEKCDIWSCGIILYILLCGYPPFSGKSENQILDRVKAGKFNFDPEDWDQISKEAKEFITKLLRMDPNKRLSAKQALDDPWLVKYAPTSQVNKRVLDNIRQFRAQTILKQALMSYMITQMSTQKEISELQNEFKRLDINNDGYLSKEELIKGYQQLKLDYKYAQEEVDRMIDMIDINRSGMIDFSEFCMAAINQEKLLSVQRVEQAFKIFDLNGDGFISKQELESIMGDLGDDVWSQILSDCDGNNDGKISYEEFVRMLKNKKL